MSNKAPFELKYPAQLRPEVLKDNTLSDRDKIVYAVISSLIGGSDNPCWLTNIEIGEACGKEEKTIKRAISELSAKDYIYIDTDRTRVKENKPIRHIYVDYKYYLNRYHKNAHKIPNTFKDEHHFRNWARKAARGFMFNHMKLDGTKIPLVITETGYLRKTLINTNLHPTKEKALIYTIWKSLFENKDLVIKFVKSKNEEIEKNKSQ